MANNPRVSQNRCESELMSSMNSTQEEIYIEELTKYQTKGLTQLKTKCEDLRKQLKVLRQEVKDLEEEKVRQTDGNHWTKFIIRLAKTNTDLHIDCHRLLMEIDFYEKLMEGPKWSCDQCTLANHPEVRFCEACDKPRYRILNNITDCEVIHSNSNTSLQV